MQIPEYAYDVCFSFAGEDRNYVEAVANHLTRAGVRVFYDRHERIETWGKDLYQFFSDVYRKHARYCMVFISAAYAAKLWTRHELRSAQARAFEENREYILPARFDDTEIPGVLPTVAYLDISNMPPGEFAEQIREKIDLTPKLATASPTTPPAASAPLKTPKILSEQPKVAALRLRIAEPFAAIGRYRDTVESLVTAGKWAFGIGVAYPSELLAADDKLLDSLRGFSSDLRAAVEEIDAVSEKRRKELPGILGLASNPLAALRSALIEAAIATENLKGLRSSMRTDPNSQTIKESQLYQVAVTALNNIVHEVEKAEEKREVDLGFFQMFVEAGKRQR